MAFLQQLKRLLPPGKQSIPIFPLNSVLFPGSVLPLKIFEQRYMEMVKECLKNNSVFGVCLIKEGQETGPPAVPETIGCTARITDYSMEQLGILQIRPVGEERFRIIDSRSDAKGLVTAQVESIPPEVEIAIPPEFANCAELVRKVIDSADKGNFAEPYRFESASWVGYRLSELLPIKITAKQKLMELSDPIARLDILAQFLARQGLMKN